MNPTNQALPNYLSILKWGVPGSLKPGKEADTCNDDLDNASYNFVLSMNGREFQGNDGGHREGFYL